VALCHGREKGVLFSSRRGGILPLFPSRKSELLHVGLKAGSLTSRMGKTLLVYTGVNGFVRKRGGRSRRKKGIIWALLFSLDVDMEGEQAAWSIIPTGAKEFADGSLMRKEGKYHQRLSYDNAEEGTTELIDPKKEGKARTMYWEGEGT